MQVDRWLFALYLCSVSSAPAFGCMCFSTPMCSEVAFLGPSTREIYTDISSCGYRFELGVTYLVNSQHNGSHFRTGACSRTARVDSVEAVEDIKALRAWQSGTPLAPRIYGRITQPSHLGDVRVRLRSSHGDVIRAPIDANGGFSFDALEKAIYRLEIEDSRGTGIKLINLSQSACSEVTPWFSEGWHFAVSPIIMPAKRFPAIEITDPPPFDPIWIPNEHP